MSRKSKRKKNSKPRQKKITLWDRFILWVKANKQVLTVVLLALLAVTFAFPDFWQPFRGARDTSVQSIVFGRELTTVDLQRARNKIEAVMRLGPGLADAVRLTLPVSATRGGFEVTAQNAEDFYLYLEKAKRLGLRVTDQALGKKRRELWREMAASTEAAKALQNTSQPEQSYLTWQIERQKALADLKQRNVFDSKDWYDQVRAVGGRFGFNEVGVEEAIRDIMLIAKLEEYFSSTVQLTSKEVYEEFKKENERRKLSWVEIEPTDEFEARLAESLGDDDLTAYYEEHKEEYKIPLTIGCNYLFVPKAHFEAEATAAVNEEALQEAYEKDQDLYRRPDIRSDEPAFALLSPEEREARDKEVYKSFEEAKDDVREKWIEDETNEKSRAFRDRIKLRLYPSKPDPESENRTLGGEGSTFEKIAAEFDFVETGSLPHASVDEVEEVFGKYYMPSPVTGWFTSAAKDGKLTEQQIKGLETAKQLEDGFVFYADVDVRAEHTGEFEEVKDDVRQALLKRKVVDLVRPAVESRAAQFAAGDGQSLESLAGTELPVEDGDLKGVALVSEVRTSAAFLPRPQRGEDGSLINRSAGEVMVPVEEEEKDEEAPDKTEEAGDEESEADDEDVWPPPEEAHASSEVLWTTLFKIDERGGMRAAADPKTGLCFLVRHDDVIYPDRERFLVRRDSFERNLLRSREEEYFNEWRRRIWSDGGYSQQKSLDEYFEEQDRGASGGGG